MPVLKHIQRRFDVWIYSAREEERTATAHLFGVFIATQTSSTSLIRDRFNVINQVQKQEHQSSFCYNKTDLSSQAELIHILILILLYNVKASRTAFNPITPDI